jgi:hypothetical protein
MRFTEKYKLSDVNYKPLPSHFINFLFFQEEGVHESPVPVHLRMGIFFSFESFLLFSYVAAFPIT